MGCYTGKIVYIDLKTSSVKTENIDPEIRKLYLGGRGLSSYLLLKLIKPHIDPLSDDNVLIISTGLLTGLRGPAAARCSIAGKSPETNYLGESNIGGHFPALLKKNGYDALVIQGAADRPVNIIISADKISITDASQDWGKDTYQVQDDLKSIYGTGAHILCIGPAGENLVKFACIRSGYKNAAGRTGMGCLMGTKKIKAIVACPCKNRIQAENPEEFKKYINALMQKLQDEPMVEDLKEHGTSWLYDLVNEGVFVGRTYNGLTNIFKKRENIGKKQLQEFVYKRSACFSCQIACIHNYEIKTGKYAGIKAQGPEYGIMANFGPMLGVTRMEPILAANDLINKLGIDSSSMGNMIAWSMELYDKGIIDNTITKGLEIRWGDDDVVMDLITKTAYRQDFGNILAEGALGASRIIGRDSFEYISTVKNLPQSCATDLRFFRGFALGMATATRGADHLRSRPFYEPLEMPEDLLKQIYEYDVDSKADSYKGKGRLVQWWESYFAVFDAIGVCKLLGLSMLPGCIMFKEFCDLIELGSGIALNEKDLFEIGERITTSERLFIAREGIRRKDDDIPNRFYKPLEWENTADGKVMEEKGFNQMLDEYYQLHGWDLDTGIPLPETIQRLKINHAENGVERNIDDMYKEFYVMDRREM